MNQDSPLLKKAIDLAKKHHDGQMRKSGDPYICHLLNVLSTLQQLSLPEEVLIAGVLHDIVEDTEMNLMDIKELFGERVAFIIQALSKNQKPKFPEKFKNPLENKPVINKEFHEKLTKLESQNFRFLTYVNRFYYSVIADPWIAFIKIADQIDNLKDVEVFPAYKANRKIREIDEYFWPIYEKITTGQVMSHELVEPYEKIKSQLKEVLETKKSQLQNKK